MNEVWRMVAPESADSRRASSSWRLASFSTIRMRIFARSRTSMPLQAPESNDLRAASMARRASAFEATGTCAMGSSVAGLIVGRHSPDSASTNLPSMYSWYFSMDDDDTGGSRERKPAEEALSEGGRLPPIPGLGAARHPGLRRASRPSLGSARLDIMAYAAPPARPRASARSTSMSTAIC